jgi:hypothetical protein
MWHKLLCLEQHQLVVAMCPAWLVVGDAGKTYVGVQIMRLLLHNTCNDRATRDNPDLDPEAFFGALERSTKPHVGPILCVCFTNHALDSFLEGLLDAGVDLASIVRCGARSKSERLQACNVRNFTARWGLGHCVS